MPITLPERFAAAMAALGPYPSSPRLGVAVSGGGDSRALTLLARDWAREQGGTVHAIVVDHNLRPGSDDEAMTTGDWLATHGIPVTLRRVEVAPGNLQSEARQARYGAFDAFCREHGVLHLLLGHHAMDKRETLLMRWIRGSGPSGIASLKPADDRRAMRLLRPLLAEEPEALRDWLREQGETWIDDPSNHAARFQRVRLRPVAATLRDEGWSAARIASQQTWLESIEKAEDRGIARHFARHVTIHPAGFACVPLEALVTMSPASGMTSLTRLLGTIRGRGEPRRDDVERLWQTLAKPSFSGATLHGCRLILDRHMLFICREHSDASSAPVEGGRWDDRFDIAPHDGELRYASESWRDARALAEAAGQRWFLPPPVWRMIPLWRQLDGTECVPHIFTRNERRPLHFAPAKSAC